MPRVADDGAVGRAGAPRLHGRPLCFRQRRGRAHFLVGLFVARPPEVIFTFPVRGRGVWVKEKGFERTQIVCEAAVAGPCALSAPARGVEGYGHSMSWYTQRHGKQSGSALLRTGRHPLLPRRRRCEMKTLPVNRGDGAWKGVTAKWHGARAHRPATCK